MRKFYLISMSLTISSVMCAKDIVNENSLADYFIWGVLAIVLFISAISLFAVNGALQVLVKQLRREVSIAKGETVIEAERKDWLAEIWSEVIQKFTLAKPIEQEADIDLGHDYDGIRELDNKLPPWWLGLFYAGIAYAVVYLVYFHVLDTGMSSKEEYEAEMREADIAKQEYLATAANLVDETNVEVMIDAIGLENGKITFQNNCVACHGPQGQGASVGPNLSDEYWIHGGSIKDIFKTIKYGVPAKGMIAWQTQLNPQQMHEVASYIYNLYGTNPANPKEPQGDLYKREVTDNNNGGGTLVDSSTVARSDSSGIEEANM